MRPFTKLRRCHTLFLLEESGELSGILEFETVGYFRDIHAAAGKQFLCLQEFLLQLILGGRYACIFFEHTAEPGVAEPQAGSYFFRCQRVFHLLFHQDAGFVDLIHNVGIREGVVSSFIIVRFASVSSVEESILFELLSDDEEELLNTYKELSVQNKKLLKAYLDGLCKR